MPYHMQLNGRAESFHKIIVASCSTTCLHIRANEVYTCSLLHTHIIPKCIDRLAYLHLVSCYHIPLWTYICCHSYTFTDWRTSNNIYAHSKARLLHSIATMCGDADMRVESSQRRYTTIYDDIMATMTRNVALHRLHFLPDSTSTLTGHQWLNGPMIVLQLSGTTTWCPWTRTFYINRSIADDNYGRRRQSSKYSFDQHIYTNVIGKICRATSLIQTSRAIRQGRQQSQLREAQKTAQKFSAAPCEHGRSYFVSCGWRR